MASRETIHSEIISSLAALLSIEDISKPIIRKDTHNWDSIKHLMICFALEDKYKVEFSPEEINKIDSSETITEIIFSKSGK